MINKDILDEVLPVPDLEELAQQTTEELKTEGFVITNFHSGGVFYTLLMIVLRIKIEFTQLLRTVLNNMFVSHASGAWLDLKLADYSKKRKKPLKTRGFVTISRETPGEAVKIAKGHVFKTAKDINGEELRFFVLEASVLQKGALSTDILVEAEAEGSRYHMDKKKLTAENGRPIADNQNIQTAGKRGPVTLQDPWFLEKLAHFDREVIPERRMHAKGSGAFGTFTVMHDITKYTRASIFAEVGKQTPCFVRFSTVAGERGAADAERDIRGFAIKFYTDAGNWDLVGNNTPVFFLRDPLKFPDLNHAIKRDPRTGLRSPNSNWDFWTLLPEALHQVTITMSPRGIPASFRHMHGFGSHTYSLYDKDNRRTWVKFHLRTEQGIRNLTDAEAEAIIAKDRESNQRDLFEAIERGDYPRWLMQVQLMTEEQARTYKINPFDLTKVWYHGDFPLHDVGILELNRNPENFYAEVEQAAFNPMNIVEGIGFSPDKMLQGRLFSYGDAQRYRLGVNHNLIPVNKPRCPFHAYHRDGQMRTDDNYGATTPYEPNSYGEWQDTPALKEPPLAVDGAVYNYDEREFDDDYYTQPGKLWRLMTPADQQATCENTARAMGDSELFIKQRHVRNCYNADPSYGEGVARALGISLAEALTAEDPAHPAWDKR